MGCRNLPKNSAVLEASVREIAQAYFQALERGDIHAVYFWRTVLVERLVMLRVAITDNQRDANARDDKSAGH